MLLSGLLCAGGLGWNWPCWGVGCQGLSPRPVQPLLLPRPRCQGSALLCHSCLWDSGICQLVGPEPSSPGSDCALAAYWLAPSWQGASSGVAASRNQEQCP